MRPIKTRALHLNITLLAGVKHWPTCYWYYSRPVDAQIKSVLRNTFPTCLIKHALYLDAWLVFSAMRSALPSAGRYCTQTAWAQFDYFNASAIISLRRANRLLTG